MRRLVSMMRVLLIVFALASVLTIFFLPGVAFAQGSTVPEVPDKVSVAFLILTAAGALIRPVTAWLTTAAADKGPVGIVLGIVLAGVTAGGAYLSDLGGAGTLQGFGLAFAAAFIGSAAANAKVWGGKAVDWIHDKTDQWLHDHLGIPEPTPTSPPHP